MFDSFPRLIAVFHALPSLLAPRHPPCALSSLTTLIQPSPVPPAHEDVTKGQSRAGSVSHYGRPSGYGDAGRDAWVKDDRVTLDPCGSSSDEPKTRCRTNAAKCREKLASHASRRASQLIMMPLLPQPNCQRSLGAGRLLADPSPPVRSTEAELLAGNRRWLGPNRRPRTARSAPSGDLDTLQAVLARPAGGKSKYSSVCKPCQTQPARSGGRNGSPCPPQRKRAILTLHPALCKGLGLDFSPSTREAAGSREVTIGRAGLRTTATQSETQLYVPGTPR